jgi:GH25 family lysozyme M1 (1,4-beta-N-acetylmuramidase)
MRGRTRVHRAIEPGSTRSDAAGIGFEPRTTLEQLDLVNSVTAPRHARLRARLAAALPAAALIAAVGGSSVAPAAAAVRPVTPETALPSDASATVEGIDVSHWQNTIDWTKVAAAGKKFAVIKATESTDYVDPLYATNHAAAKANGIWTGGYHFARPDSSAGDAVKEAAWFASKVNLGAGDLIPALDLEVSGGLSVSALQSWVTTFMGEMTKRTGVRPMIYTSPAFWKKYMGDTSALAAAGYQVLWVAHWGVSAPTVPASTWGGKGWTFWQYSNCGTVSGISGCVDLDRYNGTDFSRVAFSTFKLSATSTGVKQGSSASTVVSILRTNFADEVILDVAGLPDGAHATYDANPVAGGDNNAALTVHMDPDPTATPIGTYPLTITGTSNGLTRIIKVNLVVSDGTAPTMSAPATRLTAGKTLGTSVPVHLSWTATDGSGIASTALQRRVNGGSWTGTTLSSVAAMSYEGYISSGGSLQPRARATDRKANTSAYASGKLTKAAIIQQTTAAMTWSGTWHSVASSAASGGSLKYATGKGASATFRFTGSSVAWVAATGPTRGSASVYVDGAYAGSVKLYSATAHSKQIVFARNWTANGTHTVKIVVAGSAGHPRVDIDAFLRLTVS